MSRKKLLVADDSLTIQKVIRLALSNEGYEIQAVSDGAEALEKLSMYQPDVLLVDVSLPIKDAFDLKAEINAQPDLKHVQTVLMSSAFEKFDEHRAKELAFEGRLVKPFDPAHLRSVLTEVLSVDSAISPPADTDDDLSQSLSPKGFQTEAPPVSLDDFPSSQGSQYEATGQVEIPVEPLEDEPTSKMNRAGQAVSFSNDEEHPPISDDLWTDDEPTGPNATSFITGVEAPAPLEKVLVAKNPPPAPPSLRSTPKASEPGHPGDQDIRDLTESTMRMTGMEDFEWSVNETGSGKGGVPPKISPFSESAVGHMGDQTLTEIRQKEPVLAPPKEFAASAPDDESEMTDDVPTLTLGSESMAVTEAQLTEVESPEAQISPIQAYEPTSMTSTEVSNSQTPAALDSAELEALVREHVRKSIKEMAQQMLPDLAEKIIKEEIHRMLNHPPL